MHEDKLPVINKEIAKLQRENNRLRRALREESGHRNDVETALIEIADLVAAQDDALVELAELIGV